MNSSNDLGSDVESPSSENDPLESTNDLRKISEANLNTAVELLNYRLK